MVNFYGSGYEEKLRQRIGAELYTRQRSNRHLCLPSGDAYFIAFHLCGAARAAEERICIYCSADTLEFYGLSGAPSAEPDGASAFHALADYFTDLTAGDAERLEKLEEDIAALDDGITTARKPVRAAAGRIVEFRRKLLRLGRYYDQLGDVLDVLGENENGAVPHAAMARFRTLSRRVGRLGVTVDHLRECVTQAREAYQAQIDIEQNQIMKVFTVITGVFLPLTLIVGWYGMNFDMPEYGWKLGYLYVAALSAVVCAAFYFIFRRKKWF